MNVFISQPMTGYTEGQITSIRQKAVDYLTKNFDNCTIIDSYMPEFQDTDSPIIALGECIKLLNNADLVVFLDGWKNSKGCQVEHLICELYEIKKVYLKN